jgi:ERF superfamily
MPDPDTDHIPFGWITSPESDQVLPAFVEALWEMEDIPKRNRVEAGPMRYSYADLADVLAEVRPKLKLHGLALAQHPTTEYGVGTTLFHKSGQWISFSPLLISPAGSTPQNVGSAITYSRRYSILANLGLATEDDDGRAATVSAVPAEDPLRPRVDSVLGRLAVLDDEQKVKIRTWADEEGRKLSGRALYEDAEWLTQVEAFLDVNIEEDDVEEPF